MGLRAAAGCAQFIERVLASEIIATEHLRRVSRRASAPRGIVYLPTTSYIEMNEWTLPAPAARRLARRWCEQEKRGRPLRGAQGLPARRHLAQLPHALSGIELDAQAHARRSRRGWRRLPAAPRTRRCDDLLYRAQANDAYWHGLFGGLYLPHLRRGIWSSLLALEAKLDAIAPRPAVERATSTRTAATRSSCAAPQLQASCASTAALRCASCRAYALAQNFGDTLRRHAEHYHAKVAAGASHEKAGEGIASAHDRVAFKHDIGPADVVPHPQPRDVLRDAWIDAAGTVHELASYREESTADGLAFTCRGEGFDIGKSLRLVGDTLVARWSVAGRGVRRFRCTLDLAMPSCDGYSGRYLVGDTIPCGFGQALDLDEARGVVLDDRHLQGGVALDLVPAARVRGRPYFTVSQSEDGFERVMQSATVVVEWTVAGTATLELRVGIRVG